jgi:hypothetical protein
MLWTGNACEFMPNSPVSFRRESLYTKGTKSSGSKTLLGQFIISPKEVYSKWLIRTLNLQKKTASVS